MHSKDIRPPHGPKKKKPDDINLDRFHELNPEARPPQPDKGEEREKPPSHRRTRTSV